MNKEEFNKLSILDKINYLNSKLAEGQTVIRIREDIGIGEKALQREIKSNNYKYDNKTKQYIPMSERVDTVDPAEVVKNNNDVVILDNNTNVLANNENDDRINFYLDNFDTFKAIIDKFKANTNSNTQTNTNHIIIDLIDDKHLKPSAKGIRINEFVYRDWQKFCDKQPYSKMDLISTALKEFMEKYDK